MGGILGASQLAAFLLAGVPQVTPPSGFNPAWVTVNIVVQ